MLAFVNEQSCVDGPLQFLLRTIQDKLIYELKLTRGALSCIVLAFSIQLITALFLTDFYYIWTCQRSRINNLMEKDDKTKINFISASAHSLNTMLPDYTNNLE